ncbi:MAG: cytochrome c biogenesis CcdA family protein [bacterium]|nr:cytochrome c biogenesis CcdA family protein [bacterium]
MKRIYTTLLLVVLFFGSLGLHIAHAQDEPQKNVTVFFNEACKDCGELVKETYPEFFSEYGYTLDLKDYINDRENRKILSEYNEAWHVPFELQSHIEAFVGDRVLLGGHIPEHVRRYVMEHPDAYDRLLVYQDKMHGEETEYRVWDFIGEIKTYPIDEPITTYFTETTSHDSSQTSVLKERGFWGLFGVITSSAFLDGLNPCAFAVLLFFIAFLFSLKKTRANIWKMGLVYVSAIYLAYLLIGLGIAQAFIISGAPHLMARIGAYLVMALGGIQLLGVIFPSFPIRLRIPVDTKATLENWMYKATLPASFIGGFLVGLCTFPCSGGIYVAIIGMLTSQRSLGSGVGWMLWYNLIFVSPLFILLALSSNRKTAEKLQTWEQSQSKKMKITAGVFMLALGLVIILFFT